MRRGKATFAAGGLDFGIAGERPGLLTCASAFSLACCTRLARRHCGLTQPGAGLEKRICVASLTEAYLLAYLLPGVKTSCRDASIRSLALVLSVECKA